MTTMYDPGSKFTTIDGKRILVFGGTGSLGQTLIKRYASKAHVHVCSRDESKHWTLKNELGSSSTVKFHVGDVRDSSRVRNVIANVNPDIVISAAALKHVDTCELSPTESLETNIAGPRNIVEACRDMARAGGALKCALQVSTDKACEPVNVYGMCKALAERLFTSQQVQPNGARFVVVRYGNVLESRGSIVPLFRWQAENAPALTVTDPDMTRFVMTLDDSVDLITLAIEQAENGETWIPRLPSMRIGDLVELFSKLHNKPITRVPVRPGEKQHEALVGRTEASRTMKVHGHSRMHCDNRLTHYVINPPQSPVVRGDQAFPVFSRADIEQYTSADDVMAPEQLKSHLNSLGILSADMSTFVGAKIEEIRK